jgi:CubicO group peptidase (beta-lactamase class C family)
MPSRRIRISLRYEHSSSRKWLNKAFPSIAVAVAQDGKILWQDGFGLADREKHIPGTAHTAYYVASITKSITSTAVMVLSEHKHLLKTVLKCISFLRHIP